MSRLGRMPVVIPAGVQVRVDGRKIEVKGSRGTLIRELPQEVRAEVKEGKISIALTAEGERAKALWGLNRMLVANMVIGVSQGYRKELEIVGVGYKAELKGKDLHMSIGFSRPVPVKPPKGITFSVENQIKIAVEGCDKEMVGRTASEIRTIRPPEPYKGKGVKYVGEYIRRKAGKIAGK